ncbi:hypothetical protein LWI29_033178 [Acer saccharum]|uniref:Uncharacterized protein n=1 Tax=Acer saccharum TaxID=4024 RepID=A0AA39SW72_ACESA|nr:hypothetical protein LWI29_033178 [Acer saccharum]
MSSLPTDILATKGAALLAEQVTALREANLALQAKVEEAKGDLARAEENVISLVQAASESESRRQAVVVEFERMTHAYNTETIISTHRKAERESVKAEKAVLLDENQFLRGTVKILESRVDSSFVDEYFTASYEVTKAFPPPFDLLTPLGWDRDRDRDRDRDHIMAKAATLSDADPDQGGPSLAADIPGSSSLQPTVGSGDTIEAES